MATVWQASVEDLYHALGKAELVDGELVLMNPAGDWHGMAVMSISASLHAYVRKLGVGRAYGDNVGFLVKLPNRQSFSPDCAYYTGPAGKMKFLPQAPVFAVEVRSDEDYGPAAEVRLAEKRADYFAAGTLVVWDVDLLGDDVVRVFRHDQPTIPQIYRRGEVAEAEPAVPGWTFSVSELFE
jgi:Uma2 family endonuclease